MRRVIYNQKGGVGKSSIASNLAAISACHGYKTLLIDLDPQCNSSQYVLNGNFDSVESTITDFFNEALKPGYIARDHDLSGYVTASKYPGLHVIAASPELGLIEAPLASKHKIYKLRDAVDCYSRQFDAIYIDTPPAFNFYTLSALIAATSVLIPFDCDEYARRALYSLMESVSEIQIDHNPELTIAGIVINQFMGRAYLPDQVVKDLISEGKPVLKSRISSSVKMRESHKVSTPLVYMAPTHKLTQEFQMLFSELQGIPTNRAVAAAH